MNFVKKVSAAYKIVAKKQMTLKDYVEKLENGNDYDEIFDEMYRSGSGFSSSKMLKFVKDEAKKENIELTDEDSFDEDTLYDIYKAAEKGLS